MDAKTEKQLHEAAGPRAVIEDDRETALATARDRDALQTETLGDHCRMTGHDYDAVFRLWRSGHVWIRRRDARGRLRLSFGDDLRAVLDEAGDDTITDATLDALEHATTTTEGSEA